MPFYSYKYTHISLSIQYIMSQVKLHLVAQLTEFKGLILFPFIWKQKENLTESSISKWSEQY